jgi:uncharacterized protein (TIGR03790 family)
MIVLCGYKISPMRFFQPFLFYVLLLAYGVVESKQLESTLLNSQHIAVIVNDDDQSSIHAANYYREMRNIPERNIIHISLENPTAKLSLQRFNQLKADISKQLTTDHHVVLFAWTAPYAVECNSITSAFTLGFDADICKNTCAASKPNPYFNQPSKKPYEDFGLRLSMLLPSEAFEITKRVVDKGLHSEEGVFRSTAYYLQTSDVHRNARAIFFPKNGTSFARSGLSVVNIKSDKLLDAHDVMIYQTGLAWVGGLETLNFLPGALADHLTSFGGDLYGKGQMNALRWLQAGATASYGTVSEPCNHWQKFPNAAVMLQWYVTGSTAIEAYWKSVAWPSQGLFVGEPLAAPYAH